MTAPKKSLWQRIKDVALTDVAVFARGGVDAGSLERLETLLIESDFGVRVSGRLVAEIERLARRGEIKTQDDFERALRAAVTRALTSGNSDPALRFAAAKPTVILVLGVNGAGKTTFIGKLATRLKRRGEARARRRGRHLPRRRRGSAARCGPSARASISSPARAAAIRRRSRSARSTPA